MLEVSGLSLAYGTIPVINDVSLSVASGELVTILGRNGVGKSSLLRGIAGFMKARTGSIRLDGADVTGLRPEQLSRIGLRLVLDGHRVFPDLTVVDNLRLGRAMSGRRRPSQVDVDDVYDIFPALALAQRQRASQLSGGQQQMLALAQAFLGDPKVLMCDEPSLGISQSLMLPIFEFLRARAHSGMAVIVVEQSLEPALTVADRAIVLDSGSIAASGTATEIRADDRILNIYLGLDTTV